MTIEDYGKKVIISATYRRGREQRTVINKQGRETTSIWKVWKRRYFESNGIFLGFRWLKEGTREYELEYGYYFAVKGGFKVALVSPSPRLNPVYVPLDAIRMPGRKRLIDSKGRVL